MYPVECILCEVKYVGKPETAFDLRLFFYRGFPSQTFTIHRTAEEGGGYFFNSSLLLPSSSQTLRHQLGDYCRELTSAHSQQPDSNRELLVSKSKLLTTKLRALKPITTGNAHANVTRFQPANNIKNIISTNMRNSLSKKIQ